MGERRRNLSVAVDNVSFTINKPALLARVAAEGFLPRFPFVIAAAVAVVVAVVPDDEEEGDKEVELEGEESTVVDIIIELTEEAVDPCCLCFVPLSSVVLLLLFREDIEDPHKVRKAHLTS